MPVISVTMRRGRDATQKGRIIDGLRHALHEAFQMKDDSYSVRLWEFEPEDFYLPPPKTEGYLLVEVDCFPGRTWEQKTRFSHLLLEALEQAGEDPHQVLSLMREPPKENWGYAGKPDVLPPVLKNFYHGTDNL